MNKSRTIENQGFRRRVMPGAFAAAALGLGLAMSGTPAQAQGLPSDCGTLDNAVGPFDYNDPIHLNPGAGVDYLGLVNGAHFTPDVENLIRGMSSVDPLDDLDYTLRAFPNYHRALYAMARYHLLHGLNKKGRYTVDCWFERAIAFVPTDPQVRLIYGIFLARIGKRDAAVTQYTMALQLGGNMPEAHYNLGLVYTDLGKYEVANEHAVRAYELGYPLPGLRNRLIAAGVWKEIENE